MAILVFTLPFIYLFTLLFTVYVHERDDDSKKVAAGLTLGLVSTTLVMTFFALLLSGSPLLFQYYILTASTIALAVSILIKGIKAGTITSIADELKDGIDKEPTVNFIVPIIIAVLWPILFGGIFFIILFGIRRT